MWAEAVTPEAQMWVELSRVQQKGRVGGRVRVLLWLWISPRSGRTALGCSGAGGRWVQVGCQEDWPRRPGAVTSSGARRSSCAAVGRRGWEGRGSTSEGGSRPGAGLPTEHTPGPEGCTRDPHTHSRSTRFRPHELSANKEGAAQLRL
ncbi:hypothetical protein HJG60_007750 [Phyllostomus discolor]|uniref:Uncharacterized protein n=1 Tax=Phyllostomus discolor TaxID=89673 RepID=A0A834BI49_9CHIR|nr:hypothetical protein HJG60_007750 [Phyllostomus discolor]